MTRTLQIHCTAWFHLDFRSHSHKYNHFIILEIVCDINSREIFHFRIILLFFAIVPFFQLHPYQSIKARICPSHLAFISLDFLTFGKNAFSGPVVTRTVWVGRLYRPLLISTFTRKKQRRSQDPNEALLGSRPKQKFLVNLNLNYEKYSSHRNS